MDTASLIEPKEILETQVAEPKEHAVPWWNAMIKSPVFIPAVAMTAGILFLFWPIVSRLFKLWMDDSGYYSHGFLVPFISGYVVIKKWDRIKSIPVQTGYWAIPFIAVLGWIAYVGSDTNVRAFLAFSFLLMILAGIWFVAGWKWMLALTLPVLYLGFALPIFTGVIDLYTYTAQSISTGVAFQMLHGLGLDPLRPASDPTSIYLPHYIFTVAVPCSGLKLLIAVTAFTAFFMMIANLRLWANIVMVGIILPLCIFINGLRIALIGLVGNSFGDTPAEHDAAAHVFHDWSGYITLLVCFFILFKIARGLGWKD